MPTTLSIYGKINPMVFICRTAMLKELLFIPVAVQKQWFQTPVQE